MGVLDGRVAIITGAGRGGEAGTSFQETPQRSPDNVARLTLYLASEGSDWLTGRVLSAGGYDVGLYQNPEIIRQVSSDGPWEYDRLARLMERSFRRSADGLPPSVFQAQRQAATGERA